MPLKQGDVFYSVCDYKKYNLCFYYDLISICWVWFFAVPVRTDAFETFEKF